MGSIIYVINLEYIMAVSLIMCSRLAFNGRCKQGQCCSALEKLNLAKEMEIKKMKTKLEMRLNSLVTGEYCYRILLPFPSSIWIGHLGRLVECIVLVCLFRTNLFKFCSFRIELN